VLSRLVLPVCRRIAVKLTLTLAGFVALTTLVAGFYLRHALPVRGGGAGGADGASGRCWKKISDILAS